MRNSDVYTNLLKYLTTDVFFLIKKIQLLKSYDTFEYVFCTFIIIIIDL
jgi:hypothetical protein